MREFLSPGDVVVDAGAYKGGYTYWMRREVGASGQVFAFEPQPELAAFVRRVAEAFSWSNVHVEQVGLSAHRGEATLHVPKVKPSQRASIEGSSTSGSVRRYTVDLESLDEFIAEHCPDRRVTLIKCDVEGHELEVLRGAERLLKRHRPSLLFECEARHRPGGRVRDVFGYLESLGYRGSFFWGDELRDVGDLDPAEHQIEGRGPYANNFLFQHA